MQVNDSNISHDASNPSKTPAPDEQFTAPQVDFPTWVLDRVDWRGVERVLDVGAGAGEYGRHLRQRQPDLHIEAVDLLAASARDQAAGVHACQADAGALPYPDRSFDVLLANHVLFEVNDLDRALSEFQRVLRPNGVLVAATHSAHTMPEFQALMRRAIVLLAGAGRGQVQPPPLPHHLFSLENGTLKLARYFFAVVRHDLPTELVFPDVNPAMTYLESTRAAREDYLPPGVTWDDLMLVMREQIVALLQHFGELKINQVSGVLIATDRGGFIGDFLRHRDRFVRQQDE